MIPDSLCPEHGSSQRCSSMCLRILCQQPLCPFQSKKAHRNIGICLKRTSLLESPFWPIKHSRIHRLSLGMQLEPLTIGCPMGWQSCHYPMAVGQCRTSRQSPGTLLLLCILIHVLTGTSVPFTSCLEQWDVFSGLLISPGHRISLIKIATLILMAHDYLWPYEHWAWLFTATIWCKNLKPPLMAHQLLNMYSFCSYLCNSYQEYDWDSLPSTNLYSIIIPLGLIPLHLCTQKPFQHLFPPRAFLGTLIYDFHWKYSGLQ